MASGAPVKFSADHLIEVATDKGNKEEKLKGNGVNVCFLPLFIFYRCSLSMKKAKN